MEDLPVDLKRRGKFPDPQPDAPFPEIALEKQDAEADALAYDRGGRRAGNSHAETEDEHRIQDHV